VNNLLLARLFGFIGGLTRAFVGILKHRLPKKKGKFKPIELAFTIIASGIIGLFYGIVSCY